MTTATAKLSNYRQSPRKVRLIADLIRGKSVERALALLATLPKRGAGPMESLLKSAVANAKVPSGELFVSGIQVNGGIVFKRQMPRARGRASLIRKKTSHITLALGRKPTGETFDKKAPKKK